MNTRNFQWERQILITLFFHWMPTSLTKFLWMAFTINAKTQKIIYERHLLAADFDVLMNFFLLNLDLKLKTKHKCKQLKYPSHCQIYYWIETYCLNIFKKYSKSFLKIREIWIPFPLRETWQPIAKFVFWKASPNRVVKLKMESVLELQ